MKRILSTYLMILTAIILNVSLAAQEPLPQIHSIQFPFIENQGHLDKDIRYYTATRHGTLLVDGAGSEYLVLHLKDDKSKLIIREQFVGATNTTPVGKNPSKTQINRYIGNEPDKWQQNIPTWKLVGIDELYSGINYQLRPLAEGAEKIFTIKPGADPGQIRLKVEGIDKLSMGKDGSLQLKSVAGDIEFTAPIAYQVIDDKRVTVDVEYLIKDHTYGFKPGKYDKSKTLYIDPLVRATYFGGSSSDYGYGIAVNQTSGSVYIAGYTSSDDMPTTPGVFKESKIDFQDVYVAKFSSDLSTLEAATFYGSDGWEYGAASLALHPDGSVYVIGKTQGADLPGSSTGYQSAHAGAGDAFIARLNEDLSGPPQATYFGGTAEETGISVTVNSNAGQELYGYVYLIGRTSSTDLPGTTGGLFETNQGGGSDVFVAYFDPTLQTLGQATYFGGAGTDEPAYVTRGQASFVHPRSGYLCLVGWTSSSSNDYLLGSINGGTDAFFAALHPHLDNATLGLYLGGTDDDHASAVTFLEAEALGEAEIFIVGRTQSIYDPLNPSRNLVHPEHNGFQADYQGGLYDSYVVGLDSNFSPIKSTYLGGELDDQGYGISINPNTGNVWVTGSSSSTSFPTTFNADQVSLAGYIDAFATSLTRDLKQLAYSSYLGGTDEDYGTAVAVSESSGNIYIVGNTSSGDLFGTDGLSYDNTYNEGRDAFVAVYEGATPPSPLSSWIKDPISFSGSKPDLGVDSENNLYACYFNGNTAYVGKRDAATGDWSIIHEFPLPAGDLGFSDCTIAVEDNGSAHTCIVTVGPTAQDQPANDIWYLGTGTQEAVDGFESVYDGATGECDIVISNGMPSVSYTKYSTSGMGGCPNCKALAVAVKPSIATDWIVMDDIRTTGVERDAYWADEAIYGRSSSLAFDSTGLPLAAFTDIDGTASFYVPSDYPPLTPTPSSLPTWNRYTSTLSGLSLGLEFQLAINSEEQDRDVFSLYGNFHSEAVTISHVVIARDHIPGTIEVVPDDQLDVPEFFSNGISDNAQFHIPFLDDKLIADDNGQAWYIILEEDDFKVSPVFADQLFVKVSPSSEIIGNNLYNCALGKNASSNAYALCEDNAGNLAHYQQEYPSQGFLSVSPRKWKFGQLNWQHISLIVPDISDWRVFTLKNLGGSPLAIRDVHLESEGDLAPWVLDTACVSNFALDTDYAPGESTAVCIRPDPAAYALETIAARLVVETDNQTIVSNLEASPVTGADTDSDGIPDQEEYGPDGDNPLFDGNGDGIPDSEQGNAVSFASNVLDDGTVAGYITLATFEEHTFHNVGEVDSSMAFPIYSTGLAPWGVFTFELEIQCLVAPPCPANVDIFFHQSALGLDVFPDAYWKSGPTLPDGNDDTYLFHYDVTGTGATFHPNDNKIILYFIDGQRGDHDLSVNNYLIDPGIPAVSYVDVLDTLKQDVLASALPEKLERSLVKQLDMAVKAITADKKNTVASVTRSLNKFIGFVQEEAGLAIPQETADKWVSIAQAIISQINSSVAISR